MIHEGQQSKVHCGFTGIRVFVALESLCSQNAVRNWLLGGERYSKYACYSGINAGFLNVLNVFWFTKPRVLDRTGSIHVDAKVSSGNGILPDGGTGSPHQQGCIYAPGFFVLYLFSSAAKPLLALPVIQEASRYAARLAGNWRSTRGSHSFQLNGGKIKRAAPLGATNS